MAVKTKECACAAEQKQSCQKRAVLARRSENKKELRTAEQNKKELHPCGGAKPKKNCVGSGRKFQDNRARKNLDIYADVDFLLKPRKTGPKIFSQTAFRYPGS